MRNCSIKCKCKNCSNDKSEQPSESSERKKNRQTDYGKIPRTDAATTSKELGIEVKPKRWTEIEEVILQVVAKKAKLGTMYTTYSQTCKVLRTKNVQTRIHDQARVQAKLRQLKRNKSDE